MIHESQSQTSHWVRYIWLFFFSSLCDKSHLIKSIYLTCITRIFDSNATNLDFPCSTGHTLTSRRSMTRVASLSTSMYVLPMVFHIWATIYVWEYYSKVLLNQTGRFELIIWFRLLKLYLAYLHLNLKSLEV